MPKGSGRKGERPPRKRKKTPSSAPLPLVQPNEHDEHPKTTQSAAHFPSPSGSHTPPAHVSQSVNPGQDVQWNVTAQPFSVTASTNSPVCPWLSTSTPPQPPSQPRPPFDVYQFIGSIPQAEQTFHHYSAPYSPLSWPWQVPFPSSPFVPSPLQPQAFGRSRPSPVSEHPFLLRLISGNIRVCQGCRGNLRALDGMIPSPPLDVAVARLEQRSFYDKTTGTWCNPQKETHAFAVWSRCLYPVH